MPQTRAQQRREEEKTPASPVEQEARPKEPTMGDYAEEGDENCDGDELQDVLPFPGGGDDIDRDRD